MKYALLALIITTMVACKKDTPQSLILGKWQYVGTERNGVLTPADPHYYEFKNNGDLILTDENSHVYNQKYVFDNESLYLNNVGWRYDITENVMYLFVNESDESKLRYEKR